ncbi:hypothetical protein HYC85_010486 [Camellia sinensis]|uniref:Uncharacterized protein n=1 Tax=Camellia sinensis TaxID=4442 RepID=A0A7J7HI05_CAMSI|nr:hypothetical protein HYC85_010486 [Camellia sinensis]
MNLTFQNIINTVISNGKLDIMCNYASIPRKCDMRIIEIDGEDFKRVFNVNVFGTFLGAKHAARVMILAKKGTILFTFKHIFCDFGCLATHACKASKHAIVGLTKNSCVELGQYGIRVNCISLFAVVTLMMLNNMARDPGYPFGPGALIEPNWNTADLISLFVIALVNREFMPVVRTQSTTFKASFIFRVPTEENKSVNLVHPPRSKPSRDPNRALFLVSIKNTSEGRWVEHNSWRIRTVRGRPSPWQFQLRINMGLVAVEGQPPEPY